MYKEGFTFAAIGAKFYFATAVAKREGYELG